MTSPLRTGVLVLSLGLSCTSCGARTILSFQEEAGVVSGGGGSSSAQGDDSSQSAGAIGADGGTSGGLAIGGATSFSVGGAAQATGGSPGAVGGAASNAPGTTGGAGGATSNAGGAPSGAGGAPFVEGSFYFLAAEGESAEDVSFYWEPTFLNQYNPGQTPTLFLPPNWSDLLYFVTPPKPGSSTFLMGIQFPVGQVEQLVYSADFQNEEYVGHGYWGSSFIGRWDSMVDGAVKLNDDEVIILRWLVDAEKSQLWVVDATESNYSMTHEGEPVYESQDQRLIYHGVTADNRAVFSDEEKLIFLDESGQLEVEPGLDPGFRVLTLSHERDRLLAWGEINGLSSLRVYDGFWSDALVDDTIDPESVTWMSDSSVLYEAEGGLFLWDAIGRGGTPAYIPGLPEEQHSRGRSVVGDFGTAFRVQTPEGWSVAFDNNQAVSFCGPIDAHIRALEPHVREGVAGVLMDEMDPEDPLIFGKIHFCAPGREPEDLLSEHGYLGKLLSR